MLPDYTLDRLMNNVKITFFSKNAYILMQTQENNKYLNINSSKNSVFKMNRVE